MMMLFYSGHPIAERLRESFQILYRAHADLCVHRAIAMAGRYGIGFDLTQPPSKWSQRTSLLITYGDMIRNSIEPPLQTLERFAAARLVSAFNTIHILPFFPSSSDDGFSVLHFRRVDPKLGSWEDIQRVGRHFRLMFDLVLNHGSRGSGWLKDYEKGVAPARHYFIETDPSADTSSVTRPRSTQLLTPVHTLNGVRHLWATFSPDQLDFNYKNMNVLFEMLDILLLYVSMGARVIRLDAVAYLWKQLGTSCVNLPETHEIVKVFRSMLDLVAPDVLLLTETNLPHAENISYFGAGDEAQIIYQFSLPPLLLHALINGSARRLNDWASSLAAPPDGCTFLNFTASHDGIGVRPLEGLVPSIEIEELVREIRTRGGQVSTRRSSDGKDIPYEMNITYYDALSFPSGSLPGLHVERFLCSQAIALALKGIPAVYFNSLLAARNDYQLAKLTGQARSLNRTKWEESELNSMLADRGSEAANVFERYMKMLRARAEQNSFHPDASQQVLDFGDKLFAIKRTALDGRESVLAIHNVTASSVRVSGEALREQGVELGSTVDLLSRENVGSDLHLAPYQAAWLRAE